MNNPVMRSIASKIGAGLLASLLCTLAHAEKKPTVLRDAVFGFHFDIRTVKFEPMPASTYASCKVFTENENFDAEWFTFAKAADADGRVFYVANGYEIARHPEPRENRYSTDGQGVIFSVKGDDCDVLGDAEEVFNARAAEVDIQPVLMELAKDMLVRYEKAFGNSAKLKAAFQREHIQLDPYALELLTVFRNYAPIGPKR